MNKKLERRFFERATLEVAQDLLGKFLVKGECVGQIDEVEAYVGENDPACHAFIGKTERNKVMFGIAGLAYVYFIYGMYYCFNIVTEEEDRGCAVLIRSVKPISGIELMVERRGSGDLKNLCNGPGKLCQAFSIDKSDNGRNVSSEKDFYLFDNGFRPNEIKISKRVGLSKGTDLDWRFSCEL